MFTANSTRFRYASADCFIVVLIVVLFVCLLITITSFSSKAITKLFSPGILDAGSPKIGIFCFFFKGSLGSKWEKALLADLSLLIGFLSLWLGYSPLYTV